MIYVLRTNSCCAEPLGEASNFGKADSNNIKTLQVLDIMILDFDIELGFLESIDYIILTSRNAIKAILAHKYANIFLQKKALVIGENTAKIWRENGGVVALSQDQNIESNFGNGDTLAQKIIESGILDFNTESNIPPPSPPTKGGVSNDTDSADKATIASSFMNKSTLSIPFATDTTLPPFSYDTHDSISPSHSNSVLPSHFLSTLQCNPDSPPLRDTRTFHSTLHDAHTTPPPFAKQLCFPPPFAGGAGGGINTEGDNVEGDNAKKQNLNNKKKILYICAKNKASNIAKILESKCKITEIIAYKSVENPHFVRNAKSIESKLLKNSIFIFGSAMHYKIFRKYIAWQPTFTAISLGSTTYKSFEPNIKKLNANGNFKTAINLAKKLKKDSKKSSK